MPRALAVPAEVRCHWKRSASLSSLERDNWFHQTRGFKDHYCLQMYFLRHPFTADTGNTDTLYKENN